MMRKAWIFAFAVTALVGTAPPGRAQGPVLVRDIATGPVYSPGSYASPPVRFRGEDYFGADDGFLGYELWATNGTRRGTHLVADLCPGRCPGNPWVLTPSGDNLFFIAGNTTGGSDSYWLWRSDGTLGGTFPLADLEIGGFGSAGPVSFLAPLRGGVVFIAHDRVRRAWSLWGSDGTAAGTRPIAPLPGRFNPADAPSNYPDWPRVQDDPRRHYFVWRGRPWATDGTAAGTGPVTTPIQACGGGSARLGRLVVYVGEDEARDCEPWVSDGTPRGTRLLRDIRSGDSYPGPFVAAGGLVYFTAFDDHDHLQLWKTNGTPRGTVLVRALGTRGLGKVTIVGTVGSRIYFAADDGEHGVELWRSDGSPASTALVADLSPGAADTLFVSDGGRRLGDQMIFVAAQSGAGVYALFQTRGSAGSTSFLSDYSLNGGPALAVAGIRLYFAGIFGDLGRELGVTDGTIEGTQILDLALPVASSNPHQLIGGPGGLVFLAGDGEFSSDLWRSGGHREDTEPLANLVPGLYGNGVQLQPGSGGAFYFAYDEQRFGWTDGQTVRDLLPLHSLSFPQGFVDLGDRTLFFAPRPVSEEEWRPWLWSSDGTVDGTAAVAPTGGGGGEAYSFRFRAALVPDAGDIRFLAQDVPSFPEALSKLSATDGTAAGTRELVPIPIRRYQVLDQMVAAGGSVFASFRSDSRASLWASDGTAEGTREVYTVIQPYSLSFLSGLTAAGPQAFFLGDDFERGRELWASDGTPEGTHRVADLAPGVASSTPTDLAAFGDRVLFSADDGPHGRELWVSDGTEEGTHLLEIQPGPRGSYPQAFRVIGDRAVFAADDGVHGLELWITDGTPEGTRLAADVMAGPRPSSPRDFAVYGGDLFFNAGRPGEGYELWKLPLEALEP